ncbi:hypothetical protein J27TS8_40760 [Robertmurraya siralis]|uniref:Flagellar hook-length control protein-like C-terminal domain-containing protein n=1 Tax=Robertmurraya siralis TaxID=77777 RepID=A0A920BVM2_9BACI|nr:hypothetical protein [Robertmurraya siralis]GIN64083.1 hypothetical protein J27TS8_40760 [Robertmurraya siralis]
MQITNQGLTNTASIDLSFDVKKDEIYSAQIKQRISDKEAVLQIRGKEFVAEFEGKVPAGERATVQVTSHQEDKLNVKAIQSEAAKSSNLKAPELSAVLQKVGLTSKDVPELREAARLLLDKGYPLSKEVVSELKTFFEKGQGSFETKSDTVRALVNKGLEVTQTHLRSIHEALHGKPLNEVLTNLAKELNLDTSGKREQAVFSNVKEGAITAKAAESVVKALLSNEKAYNQTAVREIVSQIRSILEKEADPQKAIQAVKTVIANNAKIDREVVNEINKVISDAEKLQSIGKDRLVQTLNRSEAEMVAPKAVAVDNRAEQSRPVTNASLSDVVRELRNQVSTNPNLQKSIEKVQTELLNNRNLSADAAGRIAKAITEATALMQQGRITTGKEVLSSALASVEHDAIDLKPSEVIRQARESVQQEPRLQKAIEQVREQVVQNPKIDREIAQKIERALQEASQLQRAGQESAGRERIVQALSSAEAETAARETQRNEAPAPVRQGSQETVQPDSRRMESQLNHSSNAKTVQTQQGAASQTVELKETIKQVREQLQAGQDVKKVLQEQVLKSPSIDPDIARNIEKALNQADQLSEAGRERLTKLLLQLEANALKSQPQTAQAGQQANQNIQQTESQSGGEMKPVLIPKLPSETVQQALKQFHNEPDVDKALNLVRKEISSNPNIDVKNIAKIEEALERAQQLNDRGREIASRQHVANELTQIQKSLSLSEPKVDPTQGMNSQYDVNELLQSMQVQSKDILVTRVTQKLAEATHEFRELKREITRNLDSVQRTIDTFKGSAQPQASKMLETAISKLDNAILKSDLMLFTDMKTERQLLQASSQLADAKKLLAKGNFSEASKIVGQVKELIDKLNFKPSEQKIMHFVSKESLALENRHAPLEAGARGFSLLEPSGRQMFEMVRSLGLNHDSDLANSLVFKNGEHSQQEQQNNMKAALMKLQQEEANPRVAQQAEHALNNLTGQQLLSKADSPGTMQNMLFNLPLLLGGKPENLQVFVNSKNEGEQVDWENCNLYFLIETKKLGDVGIMLSATERNLTITIKNDKPGFKEKMEPLADMAKEKLNEIGYNVNALHFTRMTPIKTQNQPDQTFEQKPQKPIFTEKGMDFRI